MQGNSTLVGVLMFMAMASLAACSSGPESVIAEPDGALSIDAGAGLDQADAAPVEGSPDAGLAALQAPQLLPCPAGWREVQFDGLTLCDPWPASGIETCTGSSIHLPGTEGCQPLGNACPASGWAADLPAGAEILYVDPTTSGMQNGSQLAPYRTLAAALNASNPNTIIALPIGDIAEEIRVTKDVQIWGACTSGSRIVATDVPVYDTDRKTLISVESGAVRFRNLSIVGGFPAFAMDAEAGLELQETVVEGSVIGIELASLSTVSTTDTLLKGMNVVMPSLAKCEDPNVRCRPLYGAAIFTDADVDLAAQVSLHRTVVKSSVQIGDGLASSTASTLLSMTESSATSSIFNIHGTTQALASSFTSVRGAHLQLQDSSLNDITSSRSSNLERVFARNLALLGVPGPFAHTLRDVVVHGLMSGPVQSFFGNGVSITNDTDLERVAILDGEEIALRIENSAVVSARDLRISRTTSDSSDIPVAIGVYDQASATVESFAFSTSELVGAQIMDQASLSLMNGTVEACSIGVNVQIPGYDLNSLRSDVRYSDNLVDIDAQDLAAPPPIPEWECDDGIDNDNDLRIDCDDTSCAGFANCAL